MDNLTQPYDFLEKNTRGFVENHWRLLLLLLLKVDMGKGEHIGYSHQERRDGCFTNPFFTNGWMHSSTNHSNPHSKCICSLAKDANDDTERSCQYLMKQAILKEDDKYCTLVSVRKSKINAQLRNKIFAVFGIDMNIRESLKIIYIRPTHFHHSMLEEHNAGPSSYDKIDNFGGRGLEFVWLEGSKHYVPIPVSFTEALEMSQLRRDTRPVSVIYYFYYFYPPLLQL